MKKFLLPLFTVYSILFTGAVFAYTSTDVQNATFLADQNIIVKQSAETKYRLDNTITRAEVIGIALKMKGITLPEKYTCKDYFMDVKYDAKNNWICRAIEMAADEGIISRSNTRARPYDTITRAESLSIVAKVAGIPISTFIKNSDGNLTISYHPLTTSGRYGEFKERGIADWQANLLLSVPCELYTNFTCSGSSTYSEIDSALDFYANTAVNRAEFINFTTNILIQLKKKNLGIAYFQKINGIEFYIPEYWYSEENWYIPQVSRNGLYLTINNPHDERFNLFSGGAPVISIHNIITSFDDLFKSLHTSPDYQYAVYTKQEIVVNGLKALRYDHTEEYGSGIEWYVYLSANKVMVINFRLSNAGNTDYSPLLPEVEKLVNSVKKI